MDQKLKISVIIPVYNVEKYIHQCVDSVLNQTYRNLEVILVDDGSPDRCPQICDDYASMDKRVVVIHKENGGLSSARNRALEIATGDIIAFVDSDDWLEWNAYEILVNFLLEKDLDVVFMGVMTHGNEERVRTPIYPDLHICSAREILHKSLRDEIGGQVCFRISRRECWDSVSFPEGRLYEDLAISFRIFENCTRDVGFLEAPFYHYRLNPLGISLSENPRKAYHIFLGFLEHYHYAKDNSAEDAEICLAKTVSFGMSVFNSAVVQKWDTREAEVRAVAQFMQVNRDEILACKLHSKSKGLLVRMYYSMRPAYWIAATVFCKTRRLLRKKQG